MATSDYYFFYGTDWRYLTYDKRQNIISQRPFTLRQLTLKMRYLVNKFWRAQAIFLRIWVN